MTPSQLPEDQSNKFKARPRQQRIYPKLCAYQSVSLSFLGKENFLKTLRTLRPPTGDRLCSQSLPQLSRISYYIRAILGVDFPSHQIRLVHQLDPPAMTEIFPALHFFNWQRKATQSRASGGRGRQALELSGISCPSGWCLFHLLGDS